MSVPTLQRVLRLDNIPLDKTYYTEEGYLIDNPIVTSVGIFEYALPDGGIRRELRMPENVFEAESLASYEGKPVIITHDVGEVDKDNVPEEGIGTILTKGQRDGDNVRAKIVIHDTDAMKRCELKELSLGYNLDLDETPGVWKGQPYDAVQTKIRINHLALVGNARAGKQARLNIDSRAETLKGAKMTMRTTNTKGNGKRRDSEALSTEDLAAALDAFKARRAARIGEQNPDEGESPVDPPANEAASTGDADEGEGAGATEQTQIVKDRRDRRDSEGDPGNLDEAMNVIAQQDEDIETLLGVIDAMCSEGNTDEDQEKPTGDSEEEPPNIDNDKGQSGAMNADSIDAIVSARLKMARIGDRLGMDGIEGMSILGAKKAIVNKLKPSLRLDGQSKQYISAAFDLAMSEFNSRKDTNYQRSQMFNRDSAVVSPQGSSAADARKKMIERRANNGGNK